jgi:predicted dienelactone hydrolase
MDPQVPGHPPAAPRAATASAAPGARRSRIAHPLEPWRRALRATAVLTLGTALACAPALAQLGLGQIQAGDLPITLVYPTAQQAQPVRQGPFVLQAAPDAAPAPAQGGAPATGSAGRWPVVVLSHGTAGSPLADHQLAATLARAGFVVAQPLHQGDNHQDATMAGPDSWQRRPAEITRTLDALSAHPVWGPHLALDRVGVHGMSAGGATALVMAGATWRQLDLVRHCLAHVDEDPGFCFNGLPDLAQQAARRASYERARGVPEGFLPASLTQVHGARPGPAGLPDQRVAAVTVAVPVVALFDDASLQAIRLPVGVVSAGRDTMLLPRFHSERLLRHCGFCVPVAHLGGAGHMDLLGPWPGEIAAPVAARQARGGWPEPGFDATQRQAAFDGIAAFFQRKLQP